MRLLLICAAALPLGACHATWEQNGHAVQPSGPAGSRAYAANNFTKVDLRGSDDVIVRIGTTFSVKADGPANVLDELEIRVDGDTLKVGRKDHNGWNWSNDGGVKITVTMPRMTAASVSGSGSMDVDRAEGDFAGSIAGSGNLKVAQITGGAVDLSMAGSGDMTIAGTATRLKVASAGSGGIDAKGLTASSADVSVVGSGGVSGTVNGEAQVSILGSGDVDLGGGAHCNVSSMGSGDAHCS